MRTRRVRFLMLLGALALQMLFPMVALAQEEAESGAGTAVVFSLLGLVMIVVFVVAIVAAVGLGIAGLGYAMSQGDEG
jgi:hypothetical protein